LRTYVSKAFWCKPKLDPPYYEFEEARWKLPGHEEICWLDHLFEGGILLPDDTSSRALTMLITGPPGSGKSVLAMELCYRWASSPSDVRPEGLFCFYVSTENTAGRILEKAESFGWKHPGWVFEKYKEGAAGRPVVTVLGIDELGKYVDAQKPDLGKMVEKLIEIWPRCLEERYRSLANVRSPDVLVIDSLNVIYDPGQRAELFNQSLSVATSGPRLVMFVIDSDVSGVGHEFWDHVCDIVVRLDRKYSVEYMLRTIEIVKARNQSHVWGSHQLKIYPKGSDSGGQLSEALRKHPYRKEGGIFIYPSIHYYLSVYKRIAPSKESSPVPTPLESLNRTLAGGLPGGRCTALIGIRGGHKSHLGYLHLLSRVLEGEKTLVVSLRDDEDMAKKTMSKILHQEFAHDSKFAGKLPKPPPEKSSCSEEGFKFELRCLEEFEREGNLEVLYYPPGYITPDEFFHRMFMSIQRLKEDDRDITVLFNSLDQLSARFPLCAKENIFVPGLIEMLMAEGITSIFVAVTEPGQPPEQYGLLPMADLILSFSHRRFNEEYYKWLLKSKQGKRPSVDPLSDPKVQVVVLRVVRMPGGRTAGAHGMLELVGEEEEEKKALYKRAGLHFTEFPAWFPEGEMVEGQ